MLRRQIDRVERFARRYPATWAVLAALVIGGLLQLLD